MTPLLPITARVQQVPLSIPERIAALAYAADQLDAEIRDLKNEVGDMDEYEDGDLWNYLDQAQALCLKTYRMLDKAEAEAKMKVD